MDEKRFETSFYLNDGVGNPWAGQDIESTLPSSETWAFILSPAEIFGGALPMGSENGRMNSVC